ncbi:histidine kinase [Marinilongibacter aquaticus]|uniref:sensor histidine kinase n=1 Tax=Marinilongibacter aquaticus TaxID=2975157 RepID=UPI0021BD8F85|nr:histidine kinase [Marinilongibacter aquaticus]UBM58646.1 histidine kinase [Marinilongibacter aquaticus]
MLQWILKYKLYHIPFWVAYHLMWLLINTDSLNGSWNYLFGGEIPVKFLGYIVFQAVGAYFNLYFLIPRFLSKGRYGIYFILVVLTILVITALITGGYYLNAYLSAKSFQEIFGREPSEFMYFFSRMALPSTAASMTLAMSVKLAKNWLQTEREKLTLQKENLETELKYLKSQINPHFLFNTINSIYVLIHKNPDLASESLASFSDMLRYQLYECNDPYIPLGKELNFIDDFIQLESLRLYENQTELAFDLAQHLEQSVQIAPFIILPFVENAFKHVSRDKNQHNFIRMKLNVSEQKQLHLSLENSNGKATGKSSSGIGLSNVNRRLELLYPEKHTLTVRDESGIFKVQLKLELH